jgi:predicted esterase
MGTAPSADVGSWKISYLVATEDDLAMPEALQRHLADRAREAGAEVHTDSLKSGHFVQATHAREVAEWIAGICKA